MKRLILALLFVTTLAHGADPVRPLVLTDGQIFTEWKIMSETPATVFLKFRGGAATIHKRLLPPEVLAAHPIDPVAARAEAARLATAARAGDQLRAQLEAKNVRLNQLEAKAKAAGRSVPAPVEAVSPAVEANKVAARNLEIASLVQRAAYEYYAKQRRGSSGYPYVADVTISETNPVTGWSNRLRTEGRVRLAIANGSETRNFDAVTEQTNGTLRVIDFTVK